ncbi:MAG: TIM44-like domain-containing protein [Roseburia sp.]|nr:TIM44-like domain-containing protein [Roseburia sp.]
MDGLIAAVVILAVLFGVGYVGFRYVKGKLATVSRSLFGTDSFLEGWNRQADVLAATPKSVSGMTRVFAPQIEEDFPDFNLAQFKNKVENMLVSALQAIDAENSSLLKEATEELTKQVENQIEKNRAEGVKETYERIHIHQTEITNYVKRDGTCMIVFQSAVEHMHYRTRDGKVIEGDAKRLTQTKYNVEVVYIQDEKLVKTDNAVGTTCPNCGAPIKKLGAMYCEYCGSAVTPINLKVWTLHKFYEV